MVRREGAREREMAETLAIGIGGRVAAYIDALNASSSDHHHFITQTGRKYIKVVDSRPDGPPGGGSVHAFIEIATGNVYKAAGWAKPAEHVRFRLMDDASYAALLRHASRPEAYATGYLYL